METLFAAFGCQSGPDCLKMLFQHTDKELKFTKQSS